MKNNPEKAREHIESQGIIIEQGKTYNIYKCGHVVLNSADPKRFITDPGNSNRKYRACPECKARFMVKYRSCGDGCGAETVGSRVQNGSCKKCRNTRWNSKAAQEKSAANTKIENQARKAFKAHKDRSDCYLRDTCLRDVALNDPCAKYLPCYQCRKYQMGNGGVDPMAGVYRHTGGRTIPARASG